MADLFHQLNKSDKFFFKLLGVLFFELFKQYRLFNCSLVLSIRTSISNCGDFLIARVLSCSIIKGSSFHPTCFFERSKVWVSIDCCGFCLLDKPSSHQFGIRALARRIRLRIPFLFQFVYHFFVFSSSTPSHLFSNSFLHCSLSSLILIRCFFKVLH